MKHKLLGSFVLLSCMAAEDTCRGEFSELVADHVFSNIHGDELVAVMHSNREAYEIRGNHRGAGPSLDCALLA